MIENEIEQIRHSLHEIATHAYSLAMGLQHAAPTVNGEAILPKTVQYLLRVSTLVQQIEVDFEEWKKSAALHLLRDTGRFQEESQKLIELVKVIIEQDKQLREQFQTMEKFRFVRDRLNLYLERLLQLLAAIPVKKKLGERTLLSDEIYVYVYLYNVHGMQFSSWQNFMNADVFYEYSVNRPIYADKNEIEAMLRIKANPLQHGYLTVVVKKVNVLPYEQKDSIGNLLVKVKEGSLQQENLISFTHNGQRYVLNERSELVLSFF